MNVAAALPLPTLIVPVLGTEAELAATVMDAVPLEVPFDAEESQGSLLVADHWQPPPVVTAKLLVVAEDDVLKLFGLAEKVQLACVGAWKVSSNALSNALRA